MSIAVKSPVLRLRIILLSWSTVFSEVPQIGSLRQNNSSWHSLTKFLFIVVLVTWLS
nr:hypothetical protein Iba_chr05bCG11040 [Ipomoea batatas]GMD00570.1 hypothetical protein Iba_chr05eCG16470 [Ipomoea batatas]